MRNLLIILILAAGFLCGGFFTVDQREVAIVSDSAHNLTVYPTGMHWKLPFQGELTFVYTNQRTVSLKLPNQYRLKDGHQLRVGSILVWQVSDPQKYLRFLQTNSRKDFDVQLTQLIDQQLQQIAATSANTSEFSQQSQQRIHKLSLTDLGATLQSFGISDLEVLAPSVTASPAQLNRLPALTPESAYLLAQQIKASSESSAQNQLKPLQQKNRQFYDYYMLINHYATSAKTKQDVPPFATLYAN